MKNDRQKTKTRPVRPQLYASRVHNKRSATFINFWIFFPGSAALLKDLFFKFSQIWLQPKLSFICPDFFVMFYFFQVFQWLCLFKVLLLVFLTNFAGATFIPWPKSIPNSRVWGCPKLHKYIFYGTNLGE